MRNAIAIFLVVVSSGAAAQTAEPAPSSPSESRGLLSRLRGDRPTTRQQLQNSSVDVAQPAPAQQGYSPGVTFPQQQQQAQQPAYPAYPPAAPPGFYPPPQQPQQARPTQTPSSGRRTSGSSDSDDSNEGSRSSSSRSGSTSSQSGSRSGPSSSSNQGSKKSSTSSRSNVASESKSTDEEKKAPATTSEAESNTKSSSALEKIVKKVESGKAEDKSASDNAEAKKPAKTKEEIEIEKAREAAAKAADKATTVVASFLQQSNDGYYSKAAEHLAPAIQKYFQSEISAVNGPLKSVIDELTGNGTITMVTYVNRIVRGEGAQVEAELAYEDGRTVRRTFDLVEIENDWKIVLPVTADGRAAAVSAAPSASQPGSAAQAPQAVAAPSATEAAPPTPEQAAAQAPLVLAPGLLNPDAATTAPAQ